MFKRFSSDKAYLAGFNDGFRWSVENPNDVCYIANGVPGFWRFRAFHYRRGYVDAYMIHRAHMPPMGTLDASEGEADDET